MDITVKYTEEEQKRFDEVFRMKEHVRGLENELFLLGREMKDHTVENHVESVSPVVYLLIATANVVLFCADMIIGNWSAMFSLAIAFAACTPVLAIIFLVLFFVKLRKYIYQTSKDPAVWEKAQAKGISNYYAEEKRIRESYEKVRNELEKQKAIYLAKQDELDMFVAQKSRENALKQEEIVKHLKEADATRKKAEAAAEGEGEAVKKPITIEVQEPLARYEEERNKSDKSNN
ncbi:MAG: hypothetical protein IKP92_05835 [Lachnospiraceae bacterium]|nr:hypothetical protein [Lachnospiraceae bacterium]